MPVPLPRQHPFWCWHSHNAARAVVGRQAAGTMGWARTTRAHAATTPRHAKPVGLHACVWPVPVGMQQCIGLAIAPARPHHCLHAHWHGRLQPRPWPQKRRARHARVELLPLDAQAWYGDPSSMLVPVPRQNSLGAGRVTMLQGLWGTAASFNRPANAGSRSMVSRQASKMLTTS